tara:strand:+ start:243 stop:1949 length:1707 start_codon:yes stop_codon:yes gene_type:complete
MDEYLWLVILGGGFAFLASMGIGANDAANAFATSVGAKTLKLWHAIVIAAVFEFSGAFLMGSHVSKTIRKGITSASNFEDEPEKLLLGMFCVLVSVVVWLALATRFELPVSTTHTAIGGILGMVMVAEGTDAVEWDKVRLVVTSWFISPLMSGGIGLVIMFLLSVLFLRPYTYLKGWWREPFNRSLLFFPVLMGITLGIQTFFIIYKGSPQLKLKTTPLWLASLASLCVGVITALISSAFVPFLKNISIWRYNKNRVAEIEAIIKAHSTEIEMVEVGEGNPDESKGDDGETTEEPSVDLIALKKELVELKDSLKGNWLNSVDDFTVKCETGMETGFKKVKSTTNLVSEQLKLGIKLPENDRDIYGVIETNTRVKSIHDNVEQFCPKAETCFSYLQVISACIDSFGHGANDVANAISPFAAMLAIYMNDSVTKKADTPIWVLAMGGFGIVVGLALFGQYIIRAIGVKLVAITPSRGFTAEISSSIVVILAARLGIPVSTTHCQVGAEVGIGLLESASKNKEGRRGCTIHRAINWRQLFVIFFGWVITLVISGATAGGLFALLYHSPGSK